jgi:hypothetical protein
MFIKNSRFFYNSDLGLAQFVDLRVSPDVIRLGYLGTESLSKLRSVSYHVKLSALWSRGTWPDYSCMRSCVI